MSENDARGTWSERLRDNLGGDASTTAAIGPLANVLTAPGVFLFAAAPIAVVNRCVA